MAISHLDDNIKNSLYWYRAIITDVYDGDSVTLDIDLGFGSWLRGQKTRLYGIDAPEIRGKERPQGLIAKGWLAERILSREVLVRSHKDKSDKYGRWLVQIVLPRNFVDQEEYHSVNEEMKQKGYAKNYDD